MPTVDISPYLEDTESPKAQEVVSQIRDACKTSGFFQIIGHGIPQPLQEAVFKSAQAVFDLPYDEKVKLKSAVGRGYEIIGSQTLQPGTKPDMKEGYFVGPEIQDNGPPYRDFWHPNKWPSESVLPSKRFKTPILEYREKLSELSMTVMHILAEGLPYGSRDIFNDFCIDPLAVVRLLHYPPQPNLDDKQQLGAGAHTDFGAVTLLLQDEKGGLQVLNQSTGSWIDVPPNPAAYVVNVGDMLETWTKSEYRSNVHRVINRSGTHRYSVPFFFDGNLDYVLMPLDGSGVGGVTVEEFMRERYRRTYHG